MRKRKAMRTVKPSMWMALSYVQQRGLAAIEWSTKGKYRFLKVRFVDEQQKERAAG